jgi:GNAT superfamily N-acetyltransferase
VGHPATIPIEEWPRSRTTVAFHLDGVAPKASRWWLVVAEGEADVCDFDPGYEVTATVETSLGTLTRTWRGDIGWSHALLDGSVAISGPADARRAIHTWIGRATVAAVRRPALYRRIVDSATPLVVGQLIRLIGDLPGPMCHADDVAAIDVAPARRSDVRALSRVLGRAFDDDPVAMWIWPDDQTRLKKLTRFFAATTRWHHLAAGGVEVARGDGPIGAVAIWDPPGQWEASRFRELLMLPSVALAFGRRGSVAEEVLETMHRHHPEEPHWYLPFIGSDPSVRGAGFGQALMQSTVDRCDDEHAPAYLEASKPHLVGYYTRFGFVETGQLALPNGGPSLWPMWRAAR